MPERRSRPRLQRLWNCMGTTGKFCGKGPYRIRRLWTRCGERVAENRRNTEHARGAKQRGHEELRERKIPRCARNGNFVEVRRWELAGRTVGDFTEDGGAAGAGDR